MSEEHRDSARRQQDRTRDYFRAYWPVLVSLFLAVSAWAEYRFRVADVERQVQIIVIDGTKDHEILQQHVTKIAVIETQMNQIQQISQQAKDNTDRILRHLGRMEDRGNDGR